MQRINRQAVNEILRGRRNDTKSARFLMTTVAAAAGSALICMSSANAGDRSAQAADTASGPAAAPMYEFTILEPPKDAAIVQTLSVNDSGTVVGLFFNVGISTFDGVSWSAEGATTVFSDAYGFEEANATMVEQDGTILGSGTFDALTEVSHACTIDDEGFVTILPSLAGDAGVVSVAFDRNDKGVIARRSATVATPLWLSVPNPAVLWENGQALDIGTLGGVYA